MCRLEKEMQQARKEFAAERQKLTEELVWHCLIYTTIVMMMICDIGWN